MSPDTPNAGLDTTELQHAQQVALLAMATLAELRESDTESHLLRVQNYVRVLAERLQSHPQFTQLVTARFTAVMCACVPLYDIGTVGVPDRILLKPGRLSPDEIAIMRTHTTLGYEALVRAEKTLGHTNEVLAVAKEMTLSHQEKWNGKGYPKGLKAEQIPVSARILAVADVYDALISNKVYKDGMPHDAAVKVIFSERGEHFDPDVVDAFMEVSADFYEISQRYADTEDDMQRKIDYMANAIAEIAVL